VPEISRFFGIVVMMHYREHAPPHFHARCGADEVKVRLDDGGVEGRFPKNALRLLLAWYDTYREELEKDWALARARKPLKPVPGLE
jgi:hypothetical protein